jgi:hypothetical protein
MMLMKREKEIFIIVIRYIWMSLEVKFPSFNNGRKRIKKISHNGHFSIQLSPDMSFQIVFSSSPARLKSCPFLLLLRLSVVHKES